MYQNAEKIQFMKEFTRIYEENSDNIYRREARCIEAQAFFGLLPVRPQDLIAGRKEEFPIGFWPQPRGGVAYYCKAEALEQMKKDPALSPKDREDIDALLAFWKGKTTKEKVEARYTEEQHRLFDHLGMHCTATALYRMSGSQMDPQKLFDKGIVGLIAEAEARREQNPDFFDAIKSALLLLQKICLRYEQDLLEEKKGCDDAERSAVLAQMAENLHHVAYHTPETFWQALQLYYLFNLFSGTFNFGRMDEYLGIYYANDIDNGTITEDFAMSLILSLWQLIIERWNYMDGRVILGGRDRRNIEVADRFAFAAIEASRRTKNPLPQLTLRCYTGMNPELYQKALECIGEGTTYPILYNDDVNIPAAETAFGLPKDEAEKYVPYGCGEYVIYNRSFGTPSGAINFLRGLNDMIYGEGRNVLAECPDFDTFYARYMQEMTHHIEQLAYQEKLEYDICGEEAPFLFFSILFDDCMERGKPIFSGGVRYLQGTLEGYGNTNTTDSLTAIKTLVYEKKVLTPQRLAQALEANFAGFEDVRAMLLDAPKFGNDDPIADGVAVRFHEDICKIISDCAKKAGLQSYLMVVINNETNVKMGGLTGASADGRMGYTYMANANNPTGGMDKNGITAMFNSLLKLRPDHHAGSAQNMRFSRDMFTKYLQKTKGLLDVYFTNGGAQAMISVLRRGDLEQAMIEPNKYRNLIVRVGGFSARFVDLKKETQAELLSRTLY